MTNIEQTNAEIAKLVEQAKDLLNAAKELAESNDLDFHVTLEVKAGSTARVDWDDSNDTGDGSWESSDEDWNDSNC